MFCAHHFIYKNETFFCCTLVFCLVQNVLNLKTLRNFFFFFASNNKAENAVLLPDEIPFDIILFKQATARSKNW